MSNSLPRIVSVLVEKGSRCEEAKAFKSLHVAAIVNRRGDILFSATNEKDLHAEVSVVRKLCAKQGYWEKH